MSGAAAPGPRPSRRTVLDQYLVEYNTRRPHQGRGMNGRTPMIAVHRRHQKGGSPRYKPDPKSRLPPDGGSCQPITLSVQAGFPEMLYSSLLSQRCEIPHRSRFIYIEKPRMSRLKKPALLNICDPLLHYNFGKGSIRRQTRSRIYRHFAKK